MSGIFKMGDDFWAELKFWVLHCFVSAFPLLGIATLFGSKSEWMVDLSARVVMVLLFALACSFIGMHVGGFAKSRAIFPRALRVMLHLRTVQVCLLIPIHVIGTLIKPLAPLSLAFYMPDFLCIVGAETIYDRLSEGVTVKGSVILEAWHPFLSSFVYMGLFAVVWSVLFCVLTLPTMLVLSIRGERRLNPVSRNGGKGSFRARWSRRR